MTAGELSYTVTLAMLGCLASFFAAGHHGRMRLTLFFLVSFLARAGLVFVNAWLNVFPQKHASLFVWGLLNQAGGLRGIVGTHMFRTENLPRLKFLLEALLNAPALLLFENAPVMLNLSNCFVGAMAGVVVFAYGVRLFDRRIATCALLVTSLYPAAINFSLFGLRDILLYLFLLTEIFSFIWLMLRAEHRVLQILVFSVSFVCVVLLRPAFLPFLLILPTWFVLIATLQAVRGVQSRPRRTLIGVAAAAGLLFAAGVALALSYSVVLHSVSIENGRSPGILVRHYAEERAMRGYEPLQYQRLWRNSHPAGDYSPSDGSVAASEYLPAGIYLSLPWLGRVMVQIVGFIVIPFPWQLDGLTRVLALFDSMFVVMCVRAALRAHRALGPSTLRSLSSGLLLSFLLGWLGFALLVSNAGNAFRLRLSVVPFIVLGASLYAARHRSEQQSRAVANPESVGPAREIPCIDRSPVERVHSTEAEQEKFV
jgi:hypothetical protein